MNPVPPSPTALAAEHFLARQSFIELKARERAELLVDAGTARELAGPFDRISSPWLAAQGLVPQADDGVVIVRGAMNARPVVVISIEGGFQGGSMGEVSAAKIAASLDLARKVGEQGTPIPAVLVFESGGVRLQEANLGLALTGEIHRAMLALRRVVPVVGVIPGMVGCFGGMAIAAALCSHLIMTREGRLSLNGPEVIEQEAGPAEFDSHDRKLIWEITGGAQRYAAGFADELVEDDVQTLADALRAALARGVPARHRSERVGEFLERIARIDDPLRFDSAMLRDLFAGLKTDERHVSR
ncbi:MAG: malonate decarboxylase, beta subunit [Verrucomicrobia bacterium]|nr:malonate decarboxylase, beta subunit [Verrucomicrobiota bacterium]